MEFSAMKSCSTFEPCTPSLGCRERPLPISLPSRQVSSSFEERFVGTDSGYGSASSSPDNQSEPFDEKSSRTSSQAVFNECSEQPTPVRSRSPEISIRLRSYTRKTVKVKVFDKDIPQPVLNRFQDLNEIFGKPLYSYLSKKHPLTSMISIKLKVLGTNESDARPWIVVMCDKSISKRVKQFFNQSHIKSEYQPLDSDQTLPFFEIAVFDRAPRLLAANRPLNVYSDFLRVEDDCGILLGKILRIGESDTGRIVTLGGVLMIESLNNEVWICGMTTGHKVTPELISDIGAMAPQYSCDTDEEEDDHENYSFYSPEDSEEFELESAYKDDESVISTNFVQDQRPSADHEIFWRNIGSVLSTSDSVQSDGANLDWALIEMGIEWQHYHLVACCQFTESKALIHDLTEDESKKSVYFMGGVSGLGQGVLSGTISYLLLAPGTNFTKVYSLALTNGTSLKAGDCGSWVIDSTSDEVYGYIVASDLFGEAYVVPLGDAFRDMEIKLGMKSVSIPTQRDMMRFSYSEDWAGFPRTVPANDGEEIPVLDESSIKTFVKDDWTHNELRSTMPDGNDSGYGSTEVSPQTSANCTPALGIAAVRARSPAHWPKVASNATVRRTRRYHRRRRASLREKWGATAI